MARDAAGLVVLAVLHTAAAAAGQQPPCPEPAEGEAVAALVGVVRDQGTSVWLPGSRVIVRWSGGQAETVAAEGGVYGLCELPARTPLAVHATVPPSRGATVRLELEPGEVRELDPLIDVTMLAAGTGGVVGRVIDAVTLEPVDNALVGIEGRGYQALTNTEGRFSMDDVPAGAVTLGLRHIAYGEVSAALEVPANASVDVEVRVAARPLPLEPIEVRVRGRRSLRLEHAGFYERREWMEKLGLGHFVTREDIERRGAIRVSQVLGDVPRVGFERFCLSGRCLIPIIRGRSPECRRVKMGGFRASIGPSVYVNGRPVPLASAGGLTGIDDLVNPSDVAGIEVYTGLGDLPGEFADFNAQRCGAIAIWTGN